MPDTMAVAPLAGWPHAEPAFHPGERAAQARVGISERMAQVGRRVIRGAMPDQHRDFFEMLPFVLVGSLDRDGRPWASILSGRPGFLRSPDPQTLTVTAQPAYGDPLGANLAAGAPVGLLGIQLETRRRNRMNGTIAERSEGGFTIRVGQSFGNCPQYIQARRPTFVAEPGSVGTPRPVRAEGPVLSPQAAALVAGADTFFIATRSAEAEGGGLPAEGVDVSHRGGRPGFIRVTEEGGQTVLTAPDFVGNFFFNTFGNLQVDPRAGLVFVDFDTGGVLSLTGTAEVIWNGPEVEAFAGAERLLRFRLGEGVWIEDAVPLRWSAPEPATQLAETGTWAETARVAEAAAARNTLRPFAVTGIADESDSVRSFTLRPADGGGVAPHQAGQFLPIALDIPGQDRPVRRTYTLSDAPDGQAYRISVKRETGGTPGLASNWLHDHLKVGDTIRALAPRGDFTLDADSRRPVLLLSAGVGVTPMIAMLNQLIGRNLDRLRQPGRGIWFVHAARDGGEHPFAAHVEALAERAPALTVHVRYSRPRPQDVPGRHHDDTGHIDAALLRRLLPLDDYDVYLCGPAGFMRSMQQVLGELGVRPERIRTEAFAVSPVMPTPASVAPLPAAVAAAQIEFRASGRTADWNPAKGTLLDLAEAAGIDAPYSCRTGLCGTCAAPVAEGAVTYAEPPAGTPRAGEALLCQALPASKRVALEL
jgi:ferredoxin-NADP reductase/predicted pyridoxine 5'-phosphate oxidase superfamily flavin-nucleotide-binding protein